MRVFQQTLQNVSNPLSIAHDSRVGDGIIPDFGGTVRVSQIKGWTVRVHAQANENDGSVFATPVTTPISGKNIFIEKIPAISEHDVSAYRPYAASAGSFGALLQLDDHGRLALDTLSVERRGSTLLIFVNGRIITEFWLIDAFPMVRFLLLRV